MISFRAHRLLGLTGSLCFMFLPLAVEAQSNAPGPRLGGEVAAAYTDALRYASDRMQGTVFSRRTAGSVFLFWSADTVTVSVRTQDEYAAFSNRAGSFSAAVRRSVREATVGWNGGDHLLAYAIDWTIPLNPERSLLRFGGGALSLSPLGARWTVGGGWHRQPSGAGVGATVADFVAMVDDAQETTTWRLHTSVRPWEAVSFSGEWRERWSEDGGTASGYSVPHRFGAFGYRVGVSADAGGGMRIGADHAHTRYAMSAMAELQQTLFGDIAGGAGTMREWSAFAAGSMRGLSLRLAGAWMTADLNAVGHIESWPFTSLAATIFTNRMYFVLDGSLDVLTFSGTAAMDAGGVELVPSVGFSRIWTNIRVTHWEPEFLVFGVKNRRVDPVPISRCSAVTLSCDVRLPFLGGHLVLTALQVVPFALVERAVPATGDAPPPSSGPSVRSSLDGGRRMRISWRFR